MPRRSADTRADRTIRDDWYEYPAWYDILHTPGTAREVRGLLRIARRFVPGAGSARRLTFLEPACGTGRYLRLLAARGHRVIGFDRSRAMIDYARGRFDRLGLPASLFVGDMASFTPPARAHVAFCPISTVRHLRTDAQMLAHLRCVRAALRPGGIYAVGMETCRYGLEFPSEDAWEGARGRLRVRQLIQYRPASRAARTERVFSSMLIETPSKRVQLDSSYDLRAYGVEQWTGLVRRAGWRIEGTCTADGRDALAAPAGGVVGGYALYILRPAAGRSRR